MAELIPEALYDFMRTRGIWIVDTALCPLHALTKKAERRHASTICFLRHTSRYLHGLEDVPVVTIFPAKCGLLKKQVHSFAERIKADFTFSNLRGLREVVEIYAASFGKA